MRRHGQPLSLDDLAYLNAPLFAGSGGKDHVAAMPVNNIPALQRAVENGIGIGVLPDYLNKRGGGLVKLMTHAVTATLDCYLVYPEAMKNVARVRVFRDFLVANAQRWKY